MQNGLRFEEKMLQELNYYRAMFFNHPDGILITKPDGSIISANPAACQMFGRNEEEIIALGRDGVVINDEQLQFALQQRELIGKFQGELNYIRKDGSVFPGEVYSSLFEDVDGSVLTTMFIKDITNKKLSERQLLENKAKFKNYIYKSPDGIFIVDGHGRYIDVNPAGCLMLGYSKDELLQKTIRDISLPKVGYGKFETIKTSGEMVTTETNLVRKDGSIIAVEIKAVDLGNDQYMAYVRDITLRKQAEQKLRLSEERFALFFDICPLPMTVAGLYSGKILNCNQSFLQKYGYRKSEVVGKTTIDLNIWVYPEDRIRLVEMLSKHDVVNCFESAFRNTSGEIHDGLISGVKINIDGETCMLGVNVDITDKKIFEKEIQRLDKLNLVGQMSASIGHEIRNPMTTVRGFLQLLGNKESNVRNKEYYNLMIGELDRANTIITEFLSLAKDKLVTLKEHNINSILDSMYPLIIGDAIKQDKCIFVKVDDVPKIPVDENEIRQLLLNLIANGLDSMDEGGNLLIETYVENGELVLSVTDEGKGISPEVLDKLGTPFVTTKSHGTGLGLAVCYSIANRHNAKINVETGSSGTTFYVRFKIPETQTGIEEPLTCEIAL